MKALVCGSRGSFKDYKELVHDILGGIVRDSWEIIEGCCPDSADVYAEEYANKHDVRLHHFPGKPGEYLDRNVEMVKRCDMVIAFWDGFSRGTSQTIAQAVKHKKEIFIIDLEKKNNHKSLDFFF